MFVDFTSPIGLASVFSFQFGSHVTYELQGAVTDVGLTCRTRDPVTEELIDLSANSYMIFNKNFSISCERAPAAREHGARYYPRTGVVFGSNHGPYSMVFPAEEIMDVEFATALAARMATTEARAEGLSTRLDEELQAVKEKIGGTAEELTNLRENLKIKTFAVMRGEHGHYAQPGFQHIGCADISSWIANTCPDMRVERTQTYQRSGNRCGYSYEIITCVAPPK